MIIQNSSINIMFPRIENIKRQYILKEEILKDKFNEASILPIPDDAPMDIPRIIVKSKGEHSQLSIAPGAINFQTIYTDGYTEDWKLCANYIKSRSEDIFCLIDQFTLKKYNYLGIVANLIWNDIQKDGNKVLFSNLIGKKATDNLDDLVIKYTYIEAEKYYINITLQSVQIYPTLNQEGSGNYIDENLQAHTISITLDINDRYSYNKKKGYISKKENFDEIMLLTTDIINNKLKKLVEKGEY